MEHVVSYWRRDETAEPEPLRAAIDAEVVVVGGGMAGLSVARHLLAARPGLDLVLVESRRVGFGGSGRNAGIVEPALLMPVWLLDGALPAAERHWALACLERRARREIECICDLGAEGGIRRSQVLVSATSRLAGQLLLHARGQLERAGSHARWLAPREVEALCQTRGMGALALEGFSANPLGVARLLETAVRVAGGRVFEGTRITELARIRGGGVELRAASGGRVRARVAVICTGPWTRELQLHRRPSVHAVATYMVASAPLEDGLIAALGGDECSVSEVFSVTYRRVHERRLLFGGADGLVGGPETTAEVDRKRLSALEKTLRSRLPALWEAGLESCWGGTLGTTNRVAPFVACYPDQPEVVFNTPYQAFAPALVSGAMVQGLVLGEAYVDDEAERLRQAYAKTRLPLVRSLGLLARALGRSLMPGT